MKLLERLAIVVCNSARVNCQPVDCDYNCIDSYRKLEDDVGDGEPSFLLLNIRVNRALEHEQGQEEA